MVDAKCARCIRVCSRGSSLLDSAGDGSSWLILSRSSLRLSPSSHFRRPIHFIPWSCGSSMPSTIERASSAASDPPLSRSSPLHNDVSVQLDPTDSPSCLFHRFPRSTDIQYTRSPITRECLFAAARVKATGIAPTPGTISTALGYALLSLRLPRHRFCLLTAYRTIVPLNLLVAVANSHSNHCSDPGPRLRLHD